MIENLLDRHKDKKEYLLSLKDSIDIPIVCIRCKKYGHHVTECQKKEKDKKEETKKIDIKLVSLQDLITEAKMVKQEIKEDSSTDINEQNIAEIINLKEHSKPMINPPSLEEHILDNDNNQQNILSLINRVIFQKWHTKITLVINKEFSLTEIALIDSGADMNCIQEGLIPLKYYEKLFERLTQANGEKLIINYKIPNVHICNDGICFETIFVLIKDLSSKIILGNPFMTLLYPFLTTEEGIKTNVLGKYLLFKFILPPIQKDIYSLNTIIKEIDNDRIDRKNRHLESLKSEIIYKRIADQLTDPILNNKIKLFRQQIETEVCSNLPIAF